MAFPTSPSDRERYKDYKYDSASGLWKKEIKGQILQMLEFSDGTYQQFSVDTWLNLSGSITPLRADSDIFVQVHLDGTTNENDTNGYGKFILYRNKITGIRNFGYPKGWASVDNASGTTVYTQMIDNPNTTSEITYDIYWNETSPPSGQQVNRDGPSYCMSSIILTEIAT